MLHSSTEFSLTNDIPIEQVTAEEISNGLTSHLASILEGLDDSWPADSLQREIDVVLDGVAMRQKYLAIDMEGDAILGRECRGKSFGECSLTFGRIDQGQLLSNRIVDLDEEVISTDVSNGGNFVVVSDYDGKTSVYSSEGTLLNQINSLFGDPVFVAFTPDDSLMVATQKGVFFRWNWQNAPLFSMDRIEKISKRCMDEFELDEAHFPESYKQRVACEPEL